jgi:N-acetylglucosamine kinase-like BadF-type ATPase
MTIIADSGSTKTTWMEVSSGNKIVTEGLNPHFTTDEVFLAACATVKEKLTLHSPLSTPHSPLPTLHFYGAGCGNEAQRQRVKKLLQEGFGTANVEVETDMLGACRALCDHSAGLVGILGTGSNACYYDGERITMQPFSTGYILGDHGSANHVGRMLLQGYLSRTMPPDLRLLFHDTYKLPDNELMDAVYHQPNPNRFLASLAPFATKNSRHDYCCQLIMSSLSDWYRYQLKGLVETSHCHNLYLTGGFGASLEAPLDAFAKDNNLKVCAVAADPMLGLVRYHHD